MKKRYTIALCIGCMLSLPTWAQQQNDSVPRMEGTGLSDEDIRQLTEPIHEPINGTLSPNMQLNLATDIPVNPALEPQAPQVPDMKIQLWPKGSTLPHWATGYMYGYNSRSGSPFFGYTSNAGMGIRQTLGRYWSINVGAGLNKHSIYYNTADFSGSITWQPNRFFSTTVFGNYTTRSFGSSIDIGHGYQWGGYISLQTDTDLPFGIDAGAYHSYDPLTGQWTAPIIRPFVNVGGSKLGIDLGPLIQDALRKNSSGSSGNGINPVPRPPKNLPRVAPRK